MRFADMPYARPDTAEVKQKLADLTEKFRLAEDYPQARALFLEVDALNRHMESLGSLAHIRHTVDTRDAFYDAEEKFWNAAVPELEEYLQRWTTALLGSPFRAEFEAEYGSVIFLNAELRLKTFRPEIIPLLQRENDLVQEYEKLLASAQIPFEGGVYTLAQLAAYKNCADDARRLAAWKAEGAWYKEKQGELDRLYDELVRLRDEAAKKLGFENYIGLGYCRMGRNCYKKDDVEQFRAAVRKYVVPVSEGIYRAQAERLGKGYPMSFADNALTFRSGNAAPQGSADDVLAAAKRFYDALSPETGEFFTMMLDRGLLDVLSTEGKRAGGYCTGIYDYGVPFIFANFNGTRDDVETVTHEAGHAFAGYVNMGRVPVETVWPSLEGCEVHSMSMEFFAWPWAEEFFGPDTRKFLYSHLSGALTFIPYGTMVDHFQHIVYEKPQMTPRERHGVWKELLGVYMPWMRLDGDIPFYSEGEGWQRQHHIYSLPFYYIDYCLAQTVALEFWAKIQDGVADAWKYYLAYTRQGGSKVFTELLSSAGLESPFDESCLGGICEKAGRWLRDFDLSGIE
ncbi:MAG: M3 family oligoendopeptidase [Clostridia bacterium]|nr:M3 family oligoendopeptidase [Clostridia bacterium]